MFEETNNYVLPEFTSKEASKYVRKHSNRFSKEVRLRTVLNNVDTGLIVIRMVNVFEGGSESWSLWWFTKDNSGTWYYCSHKLTVSDVNLVFLKFMIGVLR